MLVKVTQDPGLYFRNSRCGNPKLTRCHGCRQGGLAWFFHRRVRRMASQRRFPITEDTPQRPVNRTVNRSLWFTHVAVVWRDSWPAVGSAAVI